MSEQRSGFTRFAPLALVPLSAALYAASFPPLGLSWLAWGALAPLFVAIARLSPGAGGLAGLAWGVLAAYGCGWVLPSMVASYFGMPVWVGWLVFGVVSTFLAGIYFSVFSAWAAWLTRAGRAGPLTLAAGWTACELGRASLLVGNPWAMLGYSQIDAPWVVQIADLGGPYAPTFLVVAVSAAIAGVVAPELRGRRPRFSAGVVLAMLLATLAYGAYRVHRPLGGDARVEVAVVQSGHAREFRWRPEHREAGLADYLSLTRGAAEFSPEIVVWPENAVSFYLQEVTPERRRLLDLAAELGVELIVGGPWYRRALDGPRYRNSVFLVRGSGLAGRYDKTRLVPLAEADSLGGLWPREQAYEPGHAASSLRSEVGLVGAFICFEAMYPELVRRFPASGARLLVNLSNDDWFGHPAAARHHLEMARLRAVENRRWLVRATTTGFSAIVDPHGRVVAQSGFGDPAILSAEVGLLGGTTPYQRFGDLFAWACVAGVALATVLGIRQLREAPPRAKAGRRRAELHPERVARQLRSASTAAMQRKAKRSPKRA